MALPDFTMRQLLEAGVHFGHQKHRWNPIMSDFIFGVRNNIHIIDLSQTVPLLHQALKAVSDTVANGGRVLFVGTKRQAQESIAQSAKQSAQYFVNARWLGGMLTNWKTISQSIKRLRELEELLSGEAAGLTKKERLNLDREREKLERNLGGIKDMGGIPDLLFVIDTNREANALLEARRLNIPVAAVVDTNCDPTGITYPIPGNDDAGRAINLYCELISRAAIDGISRAQGSVGVDIGAAEEVIEESVLTDAAPEEKAEVEAAPEAPAVEAPVAEAPVAEAAPESPAVETPAVETPATEAPAVEAVAQEAGDDEETGPLFERPQGDADDLKKISGVGPVLEGKLNELGITRFDQIAALTDEEIERVDARLNFKGRIQRDDWINQAQELAKG